MHCTGHFPILTAHLRHVLHADALAPRARACTSEMGSALELTGTRSGRSLGRTSRACAFNRPAQQWRAFLEFLLCEEPVAIQDFGQLTHYSCKLTSSKVVEQISQKNSNQWKLLVQRIQEEEEILCN